MIDCKTLGVFFILKLFIHSRTRVSTLIELEWYGQTGVVVGIFIVVWLVHAYQMKEGFHQVT